MGGTGSGKFKAGTEVIKTTVMQRKPLDPSDPTVKLAVIDAKKLTDGEWVRQVLETTVEYIKVYRRGFDGVYRECTYDIRKEGWGEGDTLRGYFWQMSKGKLGTFRLQAIYKGEMKSQRVVGFDFEVEDENEANSPLDEAEKALEKVAKQTSVTTRLMDIRKAFGLKSEEGGEEEMKPEDMSSLVTAFAQMAQAMGGRQESGTADLMKGLIDNQREEIKLYREELREQRVQMQSLNLDLARRDGSGQTTILDTLLGLVKDKGTPELIAQLITGRGTEEPEPGWLKIFRSFAEAPALQDLFRGLGIAMQRQLEKAGVPTEEAERVNVGRDLSRSQEGMAMANPKEILEEIKIQLRMSQDPGDATKVYDALMYFLDAIPVGTDGATLLGRIQSLAMTSERLARFALKQMDAELAEGLWPQASAFLAYVKGKVEGG